jgi:hypothetical protein
MTAAGFQNVVGVPQVGQLLAPCGFVGYAGAGLPGRADLELERLLGDIRYLVACHTKVSKQPGKYCSHCQILIS